MIRVLTLVVACAWTISAAAITIETVPVGDVGNPNDPATGNLYGGVNYVYSIGKYGITSGQYTAYLNAVAATDEHDLWVPGTQNYAGIARSGVPGGYSYSTTGSPNRIITFVNWGEAARFANWLNNGQPTGLQNNTTTEDGAYTLNGATTDLELTAIVRNPGAKWFVPSENEWHKAAYYQPAANGGDADSYWEFSNQHNEYVPPGGQPSYYGMFAAYEWTDSPSSDSFRTVQGAFGASVRIGAETGARYTYIGFRVATTIASIPEPSTLVLAVVAFAILRTRRRKLASYNRV